MPAGQHVHQEQTLMHAFRQASHDITNDDESAASILQSVKEQEAQFEQLTRELEAERQSVANQLEKCKLGSETASMSSISSTDDSFHWRPTQQHHHLENESDTESKMSGSQLVDSCLLVNRKVDTTINKKVYRTERIESNPGMLSRRVLQDKGIDMQYHPGRDSQPGDASPRPMNDGQYSVNVTYRPTTSSVNGPNAGEGYSPTASQLSVDGQHQLVSRNTSQKTTQQVTTVTKVYTTRTIHVPGAPGEPERVEYVYSTTIPTAGNEYISYNPPPEPQNYSPNPHSPGGEQVTRTVRTEYVTYSPSEDGDSYGRYPNYAYPPEQEPPRPLQEYGTYPYPRSPVNEVTRTTRTEYNYSPVPGIGRDIPQDYSNYSSLPRSTAGSDRTYPTYITSVPRSFEHPATPPSPIGQGSASPPARSPAPQTPGSKARPDSRSYGTPPYKRSGCDEMDGPYADEGPYGRPPYHGDPIRDPYRLTPSPGAGSDRFGPPGYRSPSYPTVPVPSPYGAAPRAVFDEDMPHMDDPRQRITPGLHEPPHHGDYDPQRRSPSVDSETRAILDTLHQELNTKIHALNTRWRDPDLPEVIEFLTHPNNIIKANAAAYLQHLVYMDDPIKQRTRSLGGIPPLVELLNHEISEVHRNACGALRNLSYGRQNDENKRAIKNANGIIALVRLLRKTPDNEVRELVTAILWNLSSCEDLKRPIIDDGLTVLVNNVIIPHSGWDRNLDTDEVRPTDVYWSTVFRNASGILRNVSSAGDYARKKLRECEGLVDALLHLIKAAIGKNDIDNKSVENCVCVLRNLSYRCQEVEDPDYDKHIPQPNRAGAPKKGIGDNTGCFGGSKKKKEPQTTDKRKSENNTSTSTRPRTEPAKGMELLWQPEVVKPYLALLSDCSNPETLEASAGAIQNLAACYWQPSVDIRAAVRKEKGLPILVELLRMEVDRVVCAVATALRNLAIDQRNKELIGKYAMRDLTQKLPCGNQAMDAGTSDETIAAVLATLNEVIRKTPEFARSLLDSSGIDRLIFITKSKGKYSAKVAKFTSQTLYNLWQHQELREAYKKAGYKEQQFVSPSLQARSPPTSANNTLNRPISSQGGTKYEDRTMPRGERDCYDGKSGDKYREEIPMSDFHYGDGQKAAASPQAEPVYAQVNRDRKNKRPDDHQRSLNLDSNNQAGGDSWV